MSYEKEILKIYVSDHPLRQYEAALRRITKFRLGDLVEHNGDIPSATFAGLITSVQVKLTKKGKKMANFVLEDTSGHCEGVCFKYDDFADALEQDAIVKVRGKFEHSDRIAFPAAATDFA